MSDLALSGGIAIQNLVKEGKLSQEAALAYAEKWGIVPPTNISMEHRLSVSKTKEVFNFSVYKWNKVRTVQRLILQFDFGAKTLSDIQQGRRAEKIEFQDIVSYQSEDGLRLLIVFASHGEYELDANTLDEKNKMIRLLSSILHYYEGSPEEKSVVVLQPNLDDEQRQETEYGVTKSLPKQTTPIVTKKDTLLIPTVIPRTLKQGMVEKKGHSVAFLMWPERYLKVCEGELLYYKPEEREQALNIIPLKAKVIKVEKIGLRGFVVSLAHSKKSFSFRTCGSDSGTSAEVERDEWCKAILDGCRTRRNSDARLRRGTVTAKQYMEEVKMEKKLKPFKRHSGDESQADNNDDEDASAQVPCSTEGLPSTRFQPKPIKKDIKRSQTVTSHKETPGSMKSLKRGKSVSSDAAKRSSTFYMPPSSMDVTTPFVLPVMEMDVLVVANRSALELLDLMTAELESLAGFVLPTTTGKSRVDMIVTRMGNIIVALKQCALEDKTEICKPEDDEYPPMAQVPLSPTSVCSLQSDKLSGSESGSILSNVVYSDEHEKGSMVVSSHLSEDEDTSSCIDEKVSDEVPDIHPSPSLQEESRMDTVPPVSASCTTSSSPTFVEISPHSEPSLPDTCTHKTLPDPLPTEISPCSDNNNPEPTNPAIPPPPPALPPLPFSTGIPPLPPGVPPPPPGMPGDGARMLSLPALPEFRPMKKMKRFHWNTIPPTNLLSSVWIDVATKDIRDDIDYDELEKLFAAETHENKKANVVKREARRSLLDNTRSRNIEIFLPRFPLSVERLTIQLDQQLNIIVGPTELNVEHIVALKRFQPTQEEKEMYKKYNGNKDQLALADTFLLRLVEVPMLSLRLDLLFTIREFPVNMDDFQPTLELAWSACYDLNKSEEFLDVLRYVLSIGNYLNAGTPKGNAYGFQLKYLPKLMEFRGLDKTSLLDFVVQQIQAKKPDMLHMPSRLESVTKASEISITSILAEIEVMGNELNKIEQSGYQVSHHPKIPPQECQHMQKELKRFVSQYRARLEELDARGQEMSSIYSKLLVKFGERQGMDSEDFFSTISQFLMQFRKVALEKLPPFCSPSPVVPRPSTPPDVQKLPVSTSQVQEKVSRSKPLQKAVTIDVIKVEPSLQTKSVTDTTTPKTPRSSAMKRKSKKLEPKADYLEKKSSDGKWARRYFDLEQGKLHYFTSKAQGYRQTIIVRGAPVRLLDSDKRVIELELETRTYHLRAKTIAVAEEWLNALQNHSQM